MHNQHKGSHLERLSNIIDASERISDTRAERICDMLYYWHKYLTMPRLAPADKITLAAEKCKKMLLDKQS